MQASEYLKDARLRADLTQPEAALRCCVSFSTWSKWERGAPIPPPTLLGCLILLGMPKAQAVAAMESTIRRAIEHVTGPHHYRICNEGAVYSLGFKHRDETGWKVFTGFATEDAAIEKVQEREQFPQNFARKYWKVVTLPPHPSPW